MRVSKGLIGMAISVAALAASIAVLAQKADDPARTKTAVKSSRTAFSHALPQLDGGHLKVSLVEVTYGPGASSPAHSHPCPVIGYVAEGSVRIQVKGEPETVYNAGESFYEPPNGIHLVSANASGKEPAKLIAYFVCDRDTPLSVAAPETQAPGGK